MNSQTRKQVPRIVRNQISNELSIALGDHNTIQTNNTASSEISVVEINTLISFKNLLKRMLVLQWLTTYSRHCKFHYYILPFSKRLSTANISK